MFRIIRVSLAKVEIGLFIFLTKYVKVKGNQMFKVLSTELRSQICLFNDDSL